MVALCGAKGCNGRSSTEEVLALTVLSVIVGVILAVGYYFMFVTLQNWVAKGSPLRMLVMLSFIIRLAAIMAIFVVIAKWTPLNILAVVLAFVVVFTILMLVWIYVMASKRQGGPPPDDGSGAN
jgi:hypothetical protein